MDLVQLSVKQPITIAVGVILSLLAGLMALSGAAVQMTPTVDSVVISVSTYWEGATPAEIESDVIDEQEQKLGDVSGLVSMTSVSQSNSGSIRLEFRTGTDIEAALAEVDQKISEVPGYPLGVNKPVLEGIDPESVDYIAWVGLASTDPNYDPSVLYDFIERKIRPRFERIPGVAKVNIHGAREAEVHIKVDPLAMAQRSMTYEQLQSAISMNNENFSGGRLSDGKNDVRIRAVGRFSDVNEVSNLVIRNDENGLVRLSDIATIEQGYKEATNWVRARGHRMPFLSFQLEIGANLLDVMDVMKAEMKELNAKGGLLEQKAKKLGINGTLELIQTYDATDYVIDALELVRSNILVGGILATLTLLLFLRSIRTIGIIALAIPISVVGSIVALVALGRSINIVSLAGMAFAVGMVVDNAIVVIENIYRHLEMDKSSAQAALDGTREVAGAVLASTLTTLVVFIPVLMIEEQAGQLFRDIALAIMTSVGFSLFVSLTVIPSAAALLLKRINTTDSALADSDSQGVLSRWFSRLTDVPAMVSGTVAWINRGWGRRLSVVGGFAAVTVIGIWAVLPPLDYLPAGNRNILFGILIPPPGYSIEHLSKVGERMEKTLEPYWEASGPKFGVEQGDPPAVANPNLEAVMDYSGQKVVPPPLDHYFLVGMDGQVFQVGISGDKTRTIDAIPLLNHAASPQNAPDVISFAFQMPIFRTGGTTGSAIKIDLQGGDIETVNSSAGALMFKLFGKYGPRSITPEPSNFLLPTPELRITPNDRRLQELGLSRYALGLAVQANSDGLRIPRSFQLGGELKDLKILNAESSEGSPLSVLEATPIATPSGQVVDLKSVAKVEYVAVPDRIKHVNRQRAVTLQFTPPPGIPLANAIQSVYDLTRELRGQGAISPDVEVDLSGSAGKLNEIKTALLGDGSFFGTLTSSLFLAFVIIYLLLVVLFQSWGQPIVILVSVPLATLGGFLALSALHYYSVIDRYTPVQNLDVLTLFGFVILAGVVVNNAILLVHQTLNLMKEEGKPADVAIREAVYTRVRPIMMSTLTSVGGMLPLVLMPGAGSELYRGLGSVVTGGLILSTVFTLVLVPVLLQIIMDLGAASAVATDVEVTSGSTSTPAQSSESPATNETSEAI